MSGGWGGPAACVGGPAACVAFSPSGGKKLPKKSLSPFSTSISFTIKTRVIMSYLLSPPTTTRSPAHPRPTRDTGPNSAPEPKHLLRPRGPSGWRPTRASRASSAAGKAARSEERKEQGRKRTTRRPHHVLDTDKQKRKNLYCSDEFIKKERRSTRMKIMLHDHPMTTCLIALLNKHTKKTAMRRCQGSSPIFPCLHTWRPATCNGRRHPARRAG